MDAEAQAPARVNPAGYWRRLGAFLIDWLLLYALCALAGWATHDRLLALGSSGRFIGWLLAFVYFTALDSGAMAGQSLGKRLLGLTVVDASGQPPTLARTALRTLALTAPIFVNGMTFPSTETELTWSTAILGGLIFLTVFGGFAAYIYLLLFNRKSRQLLHDLLSGTFVVRAASAAAPALATASVHKIIVAVLFFLGVAVPFVILHQVKQMIAPESLSNMTAAQQAVQTLPEVLQASVMEQRNVIKDQSGTHASTVTVITVTLNTRCDDFQLEAARVAAKAIPVLKLADDKPVCVTVRYGYDLGLAFSSVHRSDTRTVKAWREAASRQVTSPAPRNLPGLPGGPAQQALTDTKLRNYTFPWSEAHASNSDSARI